MFIVVLLALLVVSLTCGALATFAIRRVPALDPASPRATTAVVRHELQGNRRARSFARARVDPTVATGLLLTLGIAIVVAGAFAVGVLFWMVRANAGLERLDRGFATWGGSHATDFATSVLRTITQFGSTIVVVIVSIIFIRVQNSLERKERAGL